MLCLALCAGSAGSARAQDSVGRVPGVGDALSAYGVQRVRYVVDAVTVTSSWGNRFIVAPISKASRSLDPLFNTQFLGAATASPDVRIGLTLAPAQAFSVWTTPGQGVNPIDNDAPGVVNVTSIDRQVCFATTDVGLSETNLAGVIVGRVLSQPNRLFVTRIVGASSRAGDLSPDTATLSLGSVDAAGSLRLRADAFNIPQTVPDAVVRDNIARVDLTTRGPGLVNRLFGSGGQTTASDGLSTLMVLNAATFSVCVPNAVPGTIALNGSGLTATLAFDGRFRISGGGGTTAFLGAGVIAPRGAPAYSIVNFLSGGGGVFGCLGVSGSGGGKTDSINLFGVDTLGNLSGTIAATLPPMLQVGATMATNAEFRGWLSQASFRGPNGAVAIGKDQSDHLLGAATAADPAAGDFVAVVDLSAMPATWKVVAHEEAPVLNGAAGTQIGKIVAGSMIGSPVSISAPALDFLGNVYFVAAFKPNLGAARTALIRAVNTASGYRLEKLLSTGQTILGANSGREYQIVSLTLGDADSMASGSFHSHSLTQPRLPGAGSDPASPLAFGGAVVNAVIEYDNAAVPEAYDVALFIGPEPAAARAGDLNGDGFVNATDLSLLLGAWGTNNPTADLNADGIVNSSDLAILLGNWG